MAKRIKLSRFVRKVARALGDEGERAVVRALRSAAINLQGRVVSSIDSAEPFPAVDRGELRNSVATVEVPQGALVQVQAPHAPPIEHGARPFWPPLEPIKQWVLRKGLTSDADEAKQIAYRIASKFSKEGIAPRHYFAKAWDRFTRHGVVTRELRAELKRMDLDI